MPEIGPELIFARTTPDRSDLAAAGRILLITASGCLSGALSILSLPWLWSEENLRWIPGAFFGVWTFAMAWLPFGIVTRRRIRNSWKWSAGLFLGIVASYAMAFETTLRVSQWKFFERFPGVGESDVIAISAFVGGALGSTGLVNLWSMLFPAVEGATARGTLIGIGAVLGIALVTWDLDETEDLLPFFMIWQGGMAAALACANVAWRRAWQAEPFHETA